MNTAGDQPSRKASSPVKWIAIGCGCLVLLLIGVGGILGYLAFRVSRGVDEIGQVGEAYLRDLPEAAGEFGSLRKVQRQSLRFNVQLRNDQLGSHGYRGPAGVCLTTPWA